MVRQKFQVSCGSTITFQTSAGEEYEITAVPPPSPSGGGGDPDRPATDPPGIRVIPFPGTALYAEAPGPVREWLQQRPRQTHVVTLPAADLEQLRARLAEASPEGGEAILNQELPVVVFMPRGAAEVDESLRS